MASHNMIPCVVLL